MVKKTDSNYPLFKIVIISGIKKIVLNRDLLREFHSKLNTRDQCILLCLMSTGLESSDFLKLTVGDIRAQMDQSRIYMNGNRNKTFSEFSDFCSKEATIAIKNYVKKDRKDAPDEAPVFVITLAGQKRIFQQQNNRSWKLGDELPIANPISPREIADSFRTAQRNMQIPLQKGKQSPLRPKRFKKVFRTACANAGLDKDITKTFLGHKGEQSQNYQEDGRELLEYYYELVEPKITLSYDEESDLEDKNEMKLDMIDMKLEIKALKESKLRKSEFSS
jgi:site-specific recombinase XerD